MKGRLWRTIAIPNKYSDGLCIEIIDIPSINLRAEMNVQVAVTVILNAVSHNPCRVNT